jgi:DNA-binding beta-propeller fold protein YncE
VIALAVAGSAPAWLRIVAGAHPVPKLRPTAQGSAVPKITAIAPKMISNSTSYPIVIYGENLAPGLFLELATPSTQRLETSFVDAHHLTARVPPIVPIDPDLSTVQIAATLTAPEGTRAEGSAGILVANDTAFPTPYAIDVDANGRIYVASPASDEVRVFFADPATPSVSVKTADRPRTLAVYEDTQTTEWLAVGCETGEIDLYKTPIESGALPSRRITLASDVQAIAVDPVRNRLYATSHAADAVLAIDLDKGVLAETFSTGLNPRYLAIGESGKYIVAGNIQSEDVSIIDIDTKTEQRIHPVPGTPIVGGHTARFTKDIMGGKAARGIVYSEKLHVAFVSTLGPNIGPNTERMEVSMNGGVSVIDAQNAKYLRHVSILYGAAEGLQLDDDRGLLYVADGSTGRIVVMDAKRLAESDKAAQKAILSTFMLPAPEATPRIRPDDDFSTNGRATLSLHFGPKAIHLSLDAKSLFVMSRFSGEVLELDTTRARVGLVELNLWPGWIGKNQSSRRTGEIIYDTDLGNTRMSCDTCHPEGHVGGILFSKGTPIRIYRAHSMRGVRWSAPYFTPSRLPSIKEMARRVLTRNRFQNPPTSEDEANALTEYVGAIAQPPNPYVGKNGELPQDLSLPDGAHGNAVRGLALFEGKGGCAIDACHPSPHFTGDQDPATRGQLTSVGTPIAIPLRETLQDLSIDYGQPPPTLVAIWDMFPLYLSGAGGNLVDANGTVVAKTRFVLRDMIEEAATTKKHGNAGALTAEEKNDLLAYLLTL